jgi:hypothetical protein
MKPWQVAVGAVIIFCAIYLAFPPKAFAQYSTYYTDRNGLPAGQAWTYGNQTFYTDQYGRPVGSAATNGIQPPQPLGMPYPPQIDAIRIEPIRPIEPIQPIQPLRLQ